MVNMFRYQCIALSILVIIVDIFFCYPLNNKLSSSVQRASSLQTQETAGSENTRNIDLKLSQLEEGSDSEKYFEDGGKYEGLDDSAEFYNELEESSGKLESFNDDECYVLEDIRDRLDALEDSRYKRETRGENQDNYLSDVSDSLASSDKKPETFNKAYDRSENVDNNLGKLEESDYNLELEANDEPETVALRPDQLNELEENIEDLDKTVEKLQGSEMSDQQLVAFHDIAAKIQDLAALDDQAEGGYEKQDKVDSLGKSGEFVADEIEDVDDTPNNEENFNENSHQVDSLDENSGTLEGSEKFMNQKEGSEKVISDSQRISRDSDSQELEDESQLFDDVNPHLLSKRETNHNSYADSSGKLTAGRTRGDDSPKGAAEKFNDDLNRDSEIIDNSLEINEFDNNINDSEQDDNVEMVDDSSLLENTDQFLEEKRKLSEEGLKHIHPEMVQNQGMRGVGAKYEDHILDENKFDSEDAGENALDSELSADDEMLDGRYSGDKQNVKYFNKEIVNKRDACGGKNKTCGTLENVDKASSKKIAEKIKVVNADKKSAISEDDNEYRYEENEIVDELDNLDENEGNSDNRITDEKAVDSVNLANNADEGKKTNSDQLSDKIYKSVDENDKIKNDESVENVAENENGDGNNSVREGNEKSDESKVSSSEKEASEMHSVNQESDKNKVESSVASDNLCNKEKSEKSYYSKSTDYSSNDDIPLERDADLALKKGKSTNRRNVDSNVVAANIVGKVADLLKGAASKAAKEDVIDQSDSQKGQNYAETTRNLNSKNKRGMNLISSPNLNNFCEKKPELSHQLLVDTRPEMSEDVFKNLYIQQLCDEIKHQMELSYMANIPAEKIPDIVKRELEHDLKNMNSRNSRKRKRAITQRHLDKSQNIGDFLKGEVAHGLPLHLQKPTRDIIGDYIEKIFSDYFKNPASGEMALSNLHNSAENSNSRSEGVASKDVKVYGSPDRVIINGVPEMEYFQLYPTKKESLEHSKNKKSYMTKDSTFNNPYLDNSLDNFLHNLKDGNMHNHPEYLQQSQSESKPFTRLANQLEKKPSDKVGLNGEYIKIEVFNIDDGENHDSKHKSKDSECKKNGKSHESKDSSESKNHESKDSSESKNHESKDSSESKNHESKDSSESSNQESKDSSESKNNDKKHKSKDSSESKNSDKKHESKDCENKHDDKKMESEESMEEDKVKPSSKDKSPESLLNDLEKQCRKKLKPMYVEPELLDSVGQLHERRRRHLLSYNEGDIETEGQVSRNHRMKRNPQKDTFWAKAKREVEILSRLKDPAEDNKPYYQNNVKRRLGEELGQILNSETKLYNNRNARASNSLKSKKINNELNSILIDFADNYLNSDESEVNSNDNNIVYREGPQSFYENGSPIDEPENEYDYSIPKRRRLLGLSYSSAEMPHNTGYRASKRADNLIDWAQALKPHASIRKRDLSTDPLNGYDAIPEQGNMQKQEEEETVGKKDLKRDSHDIDGVKVERGDNVEKEAEKRDLSGDSVKNVDARKEGEKSLVRVDAKRAEELIEATKKREVESLVVNNVAQAAAEMKIPNKETVPVLTGTNSQLPNSVDSVKGKVTVKRHSSHLEHSNGLENEPLMNRLGRMDLSQTSLDRFADIKERTGRTDLSGIAMNTDIKRSNLPEERDTRSVEQLMSNEQSNEQPLNDLELGLLKILQKLDMEEGEKKQDLSVQSENSIGENELLQSAVKPKLVSEDKRDDINSEQINTEVTTSGESPKKHVKKRDLAEDLMYSFGGPSEDSDRRGNNVKKALNADYMDYLDDSGSNPGENVEKRSLDHVSDNADNIDYVPSNQLSEVDMLLTNGENSWSDVSMDYDEENTQQKRDVLYPLEDSENFQDKLDDIVEKHTQGVKAGYDKVGNYISPEIVERITGMRRKRGNNNYDNGRKRMRRHKIRRPAYLFPSSDEYERDEYDRDDDLEDEDDEDSDEEEETYEDNRRRRGGDVVERCLDNGDIEDETINKEETPSSSSKITSTWNVRFVMGLLVCLRHYSL